MSVAQERVSAARVRATAVSRRGSRPARWEVLALLAGALVSGAVVLAASTRVWFSADFWGLIAARPGGLPLLLEPHAGHPALLHSLGAVTVAEATGLGDGFPWVMLPRVVAWTVLVVAIWWVARARGADRRVAVAAALVLFVYGGTSWLTAWFVGGPLAMACVIVAGWTVVSVAEPSWRDGVLVGLLLLLAAASTTTGLLGVVAVSLVVVAARRRVVWLVPILVVAVVYAAWRAVIERGAPAPATGPAELLSLPVDALLIARSGFARLFTVPTSWGWLLVAAVVATLAWAVWRRRTDAFDAIVVLWGGAYVAATVLVRIAAGQASVDTIRYGYVVVLLTTVLVLPRIRLPGTRAAAAGLVVVTAVLGVRNADLLVHGLGTLEDRSLASRHVVEAAAAMIAAGEPFVEGAAVDFPRAGMLTSDQLASLVADGWSPDPATSPSSRAESAERAARGDLRVLARFFPLPADAECTPIRSEGRLDVGPRAWLVVAEPPTVLETRDEFGVGEKLLRGSGSYVVRTAEGTTVSVVDFADGLQVCRPAGSAAG